MTKFSLVDAAQRPPVTHPTAFPGWEYNADHPNAETLAIQRVLRSNQFTMGPEVARFEEELAAYHGRRHAIMVNSGSSANLIAVAALKIQHAREGKVEPPYHDLYEGSVLLPAIAWATTYAPFFQYRYRPTILDVDDTWNVPAGALGGGHHITCVAPILGNPIDMAACDPKTDILEDNCESLGARNAAGQLMGTLGLLSTVSFYHSHQLGAIEGGAILTDNDGAAARCRTLRNHGNRPESDHPLERYRFVSFGYNVRPLEMHAAVARERLRVLDETVDQRRNNLIHFLDATRGLSITPQKLTPGGAPSPFGLAFTVDDASRRPALVEAFLAAGIDCRPPTGGSFSQHPYGEFWVDTNPTPTADRVHNAGLFLGNAPFPISRLIERAVKVMKDVL